MAKEKQVLRQKGFAHVWIVVLVLVVFVAAGLGFFAYQAQKNTNYSSSDTRQTTTNTQHATTDTKKPDSEDTITSFDECAEAGNPIQQSYPEVCVTKAGKSFTKGAL